MKKIIFSLLLLSAIFAGCTSTTHFRSISNQVVLGTHYQNIIIHSNLKNFDSRKSIEDEFANKFQEIGVNALPSYKIFSPESNYTLVEKKKIIQSLGFDAVMMIKIINSKVTVGTEKIVGKVPQENPLPNQEPEPNFVESVVDITTAHFKIQSTLLDTRNFKAVWTAETGSRTVNTEPHIDRMVGINSIPLQPTVSIDQIMDSYSSTIIDEFKNEGVVVSKKKQ